MRTTAILILAWLFAWTVAGVAAVILGWSLQYTLHLLTVVALSFVALVRANRTRGTVDDRISAVLTEICGIFGAYAVAILLFRLPFSRVLLGSIIPLTVLAGLALAWIRARKGGIRAAIIVPLTPEIPHQLAALDKVSDPDADLSFYDVLLVSLTGPVSADWSTALSRSMMAGCRIRHIQDYLEEVYGQVSIEHFEIEHLPAAEFSIYSLVKRWMDLIGVVILAPLAIPLVLICSLVIGLSSGLPIFFVQERVGYGGKPFRMWKLRTMRPDHGQPDAATVPGDSRITPAGRWIRRARLDELPQLWNVLKGDMSLIGPRPEAVSFHHAYVMVEPKFAYRCLVRPGISGWAQVNAPPSANAGEAIYKAQYDLYYVKHKSLAMDLRIGIQTIWTLLHGGGAR